MPRLTWNDPGSRQFEAGVNNAVLYAQGKAGVAWNGLATVTRNIADATPKLVWIDGEVWRRDGAMAPYQAGIQAYNYPDEFLPCDGQYVDSRGIIYDSQNREEFDLCFRTGLGNDLLGTDYGYKLHLVYNAMATPSALAYASHGASVAPALLSWTIDTRPLRVVGYAPTAHITIDSTKTTPAIMALLENELYGTSTKAARMPRPDELPDIFAAAPVNAGLYPATNLYPSSALHPRAG